MFSDNFFFFVECGIDVGISLVFVAVIFIIGMMVVGGVCKMVCNVVVKSDRIDDMLGGFFVFFVYYGIMVIVVIVVFNCFGVEMISFVVVLGVVIFVIGFVL